MACEFVYKGGTYTKDEVLDKIKSENIYVRGKESEARKWLSDKLGLTEKEVSFVKGLIDGKSFGRFLQDGKIILSDKLEQSSEVHEAFHRVFNNYLTPSERIALRKEFYQREDKDRALVNAKEKYPELNNDDLIEEVIAEEFRDYVLSGGTYKFANKEQGSLFERFLNFLKNIVGKLQGKVYNQEDLFEKINNSDYKGKAITGYATVGKDRRISFQGTELDELNSQALMRGTLFLFTKKLVENNIDFSAITSGSVKVNDFFLETTYGEPILQTLLEEVTTQASYDILDKMNDENDFDEFFKSFEGYLNSFKIKLSIQDSAETNEQEDVEKAKETEFGNDEPSKSDLGIRASIEVDPYQSISNQIKLILATAPKLDDSGEPVLNEVGLPEGEDPQFVYTMLSQTLAGIPADNDLFLLRMLDLSGKFPFLEDIIYKVGLDKGINDFSDSLADVNKIKLINDFIQAFAKARYKYNITMISEDGTRIYSSDAEVENSTKKLKNDWQLQFNNKNINNFEKFKRQINDLPEKLSTDNHISDFINILGLSIDSTYLQRSELKTAITHVYSRIKAGIKEGKEKQDFLKLFTETKQGFEVSGSLDKIAKNIATDETFVNLQHYNSEGKLVYGISLNSNFSIIADNLNYIVNQSDTPEDREIALKREFPHLFTAYSANSQLIKGLLQGYNIKIGIADGVKDQSGDGTSTSDLSPQMRLVQILNETLLGTYHFIQTGDRGTVNNFEFTNKSGEKELFLRGPVDKAKLQETFLGYLKDEVETHKQISKDGSPFIYVEDRNKSYGLRFFADVFTRAEQSNLFNAEDIDAELAKPVYLAKIETFLEKKARDYQKDLENSGILQTYNNRIIGISTELNEKLNLVNADDIIYYSFVNQVIANIEQTKVFFGDLAAFKDTDEIFKRLSQFNSTRKISISSDLNNAYIRRTNNANPIKLSDDNYLNYNSSVNGDYTSFNETTLLDGNTRETEAIYKEIEEIAKESLRKDYPNESKAFVDGLAKAFTNSYLKYEEGDGASWVNIYFYREMMFKSGAWDAVSENIWRKIVGGENITTAEAVRLTMQKPSYVGPTDNSTFTTGHKKTSYMPLIPQIIKGTNLEALHEKMLRDGIAVVHMNSAAKFGAKGELGGKLKSFYSQGKLNTEDWVINELNWKYFGIQLDMNRTAKESITQATQATKNMLHNLFEGGIPRDYKGKDWEYDKKLWSTYSEEQQNRISKLAKAAFEYNKLLNQLIDADIRELKEEIGYKDGIITNYKAFKEILAEEAKDRSSSDNVMMSIELFINDSGKAVPINTLSTKDKVEQIIMSVVTNRIIRQKRFGDTIPQGSIKGLEAKGFTKEFDANNKAYFTSNKLKFRDSKGRTEFAVPLPNELIKYVEKLEGNTFEEKLAKFNSELDSHIPESGRIFHGLRIPNQAYASNTPGIIKEYLEPTINTIIVPSSWVAQTGSDFDIDKLFNYFKSLRVTKDNKIEEVKFFDKVSLEKELTKLETYLANIYRSRSIDAEEEGVYDPAFKAKSARVKEIKESLGKKGNFRKGVQNKLIDVTHELLLHPDNLRQLYAPTDDSYLKKDLLQKILKAKGATKDEKSGLYVAPHNKLSITDVFLPSTSNKKFKDFFGSKAGLGMVARHIPNHAITQIKNLKIAPQFKTWFNDNNNSLAGVREHTGKWITEVLSAYLTGNVDAGKNPYLPEIGITKDTQDIATMLLRRGAGYEQISFFLSQPIIQKYLHFRAINESDIVKKTGRNGLEKSNIDVARQAMDFFGITEKIETNKQTRDIETNKHLIGVEKHTDKALLDGLKLFNGDFDMNNSPKITDSEKLYQFRILMEYINYTSQSRKFNNFIKMSNPDTNGDKNISEALETINEIQQVKDDGFIEGFENKWLNEDDSFGGILMPYMEAQKIKQAFKDLDLIYKNPQISAAIASITKQIVPIFKKSETKRLDKINKAIHDDLILYTIQTKLREMKQNLTSTISGEDSVAKQLEKIKTDKNNPLYGNKFLDIIAPLVGNTKLGDKVYDNFQPWTKKLNAYAVDLYTDELQKVRQLNKKLFDMIVVGNFMQAGMGNSPFQINHIIPAELYHNLTSTLLEDFNPSAEDLSIFAKEFALNRTNLLTYLSEMELTMDDPWNLPKIYKTKINGEVVVRINNQTYVPQGNGYNILQYGLENEGLPINTNPIVQTGEQLGLFEQEVIEQPINKEIKPKIDSSKKIGNYSVLEVYLPTGNNLDLTIRVKNDKTGEKGSFSIDNSGRWVISKFNNETNDYEIVAQPLTQNQIIGNAKLALGEDIVNQIVNIKKETDKVEDYKGGEKFNKFLELTKKIKGNLTQEQPIVEETKEDKVIHMKDEKPKAVKLTGFTQEVGLTKKQLDTSKQPKIDRLVEKYNNKHDTKFFVRFKQVGESNLVTWTIEDRGSNKPNLNNEIDPKDLGGQLGLDINCN